METRSLAAVLHDYMPSSPPEHDDVGRIRDMVASGADPWSRDSPLHCTASALVVHRATARVLLRWHERQQAWIQLGGHADDGEDVPLMIALRETREESGLRDLAVELDGTPAHIVIVPVPAREQEPAHEHADIRYVLSTEMPDLIVAEHPGAELRWLRLDDAVRLTSEANVRETLRRVEAVLPAR